MGEYIRELILIAITAVVAFAIAGVYAIIRMSIFGDKAEASMIESLIVFIVSIVLGCGIVNKIIGKR